jgi:hypothetical protein
MKRTSLVALALLALVACNTPPKSPDGGSTAEPAAVTPADPAVTPPGPPPENLLANPERSKLTYDLDQYSLRYMEARDNGEMAAWTSLHETVLRPLVDKNLDALLAMLASGSEPGFRRIAIRGVGFGSDAPRIAPALLPLLADRDTAVVSDALVSLYLLGWPETPVTPIVSLLNHPDVDVRNNDALLLLRVLRERSRAGMPPSEEVRAASGRLVFLVTDPKEDEFVRAHAAAALGAVGDPAATDVLVNLLGDRSSVVRTRAAEGLGLLGRPEAIPALLQDLGAGRSPSEARVICASLEAIARENRWPCDIEALGTDPTNWRAWYMAVSR